MMHGDTDGLIAVDTVGKVALHDKSRPEKDYGDEP
jgi:hypothetical protein